MSDTPAPLPCPWCGKVPTDIRETDGLKWGAVVCCGTGPEVRTSYLPVEHWREAAINAWNDRVAQSEPGLRAVVQPTCKPLGFAATPLVTQDTRWCPKCRVDWRGGPMPTESGDTCSAQRYFSRLIGVEVQGGYDGVSWWRCPDCKAEWNRWTGEEATHA